MGAGSADSVGALERRGGGGRGGGDGRRGRQEGEGRQEGGAGGEGRALHVVAHRVWQDHHAALTLLQLLGSLHGHGHGTASTATCQEARVGGGVDQQVCGYL